MAQDFKSAYAALSESGKKEIHDMIASGGSNKFKSSSTTGNVEPQSIACDLIYVAAVEGCKRIDDSAAQQACILVAERAYRACKEGGW